MGKKKPLQESLYELFFKNLLFGSLQLVEGKFLISLRFFKRMPTSAHSLTLNMIRSFETLEISPLQCYTLDPIGECWLWSLKIRCDAKPSIRWKPMCGNCFEASLRKMWCVLFFSELVRGACQAQEKVPLHHVDIWLGFFKVLWIAAWEFMLEIFEPPVNFFRLSKKEKSHPHVKLYAESGLPLPLQRWERLVKCNQILTLIFESVNLHKV